MEHNQQNRIGGNAIEAKPFRMDVLDRALKRYPVVLIVVFAGLFFVFTSILRAPSGISAVFVIYGAIALAGADQARFLWRHAGREVTGPVASKLAMIQTASGALTIAALLLVRIAEEGGAVEAIPALFTAGLIFSVLYFAAARAGVALGVWSIRF